jgi:hypothetical protein
LAKLSTPFFNRMIDQKIFERIIPVAYQWAQEQEEFVLKHGAPLSSSQIADAQRCGVVDCPRVRVLVVDRIPLPDDEELAGVTQRAQIITSASRTVTVGHGIMIRADSWQNRELLLHALVHVAQCERSGGLRSFVEQYLSNRATCANFSVGPFEDEARGLARAICARDNVAN